MTSVLPLGTPIRHRYGRHRDAPSAPAESEISSPTVAGQTEIEPAFAEEWSRTAARVFLAWLAAPSGGRWLDAGCGLGTLTQTLLEHTAPIEVVGIDSSALHVAGVEAGIADFRARFQVGDLERLRFSAGRFDTVVSGLAIDALTNPILAAEEQVRVVRAKGTVGSYVWDFDDGMQVVRAFWDAATALDPAALVADPSGKRAAWRPGRLAQLFKQAGLHDVEARGLAVPTPFHSVDDFWGQLNAGGSGHLTGQGSALQYLQSLSDQHRSRLRELLARKLSGLEHGSLGLMARIWAVKGIK